MELYDFSDFIQFLGTLIPLGIISSTWCKVVLWFGLIYFGIIALCNLAKYLVATYSHIVKEIRSVRNNTK